MHTRRHTHTCPSNARKLADRHLRPINAAHLKTVRVFCLPFREKNGQAFRYGEEWKWRSGSRNGVKQAWRENVGEGTESRASNRWNSRTIYFSPHDFRFVPISLRDRHLLPLFYIIFFQRQQRRCSPGIFQTPWAGRPIPSRNASAKRPIACAASI